MALFDSMDGLDSIRMSGAQASDWYIDNAKKAMEEGRILFAGKYSEPDYEMLVDEDCDLAIESTMILHTPKSTGNDRRSGYSGIYRPVQL